MKCIYTVLSFVVLVSAKPGTHTRNVLESQGHDVSLNNLIDYSNPEIVQFIVKRGLDPLYLPNAKQKLWTKATATNVMLYKADLSLYSGILNDLSLVERYGDATLSYKNGTMKLEAGFSFKLLKAMYEYDVKMGFFNFNGRIDITIRDARTKIIITFDTKTYTLALNQLVLNNGDMKVVIEDKKGKTKWIWTTIVNMIIRFFENTIMKNVRTKATDAIQKYLDTINRIIAPLNDSPPFSTFISYAHE